MLARLSAAALDGLAVAGGHLRRTRRRARLCPVLPLAEVRLRLVQPFPRADRAHLGRAGCRVGGFGGEEAVPRDHHQRQEGRQEDRLIRNGWLIDWLELID